MKIVDQILFIAVSDNSYSAHEKAKKEQAKLFKDGYILFSINANNSSIYLIFNKYEEEKEVASPIPVDSELINKLKSELNDVTIDLDVALESMNNFSKDVERLTQEKDTLEEKHRVALSTIHGLEEDLSKLQDLKSLFEDGNSAPEKWKIPVLLELKKKFTLEQLEDLLK